MAHPLARENCTDAAQQVFEVGGERYRFGGRLGNGAVGLVRKATRLKDDARVAVKLLAPDPKYIEEAVFDDVAARFKREGERGAKLSHPSLVRVFGYSDNVDGAAFIKDGPKNPLLVMECISGKTLESYIKKQPKPAQPVFRVTKETLSIAVQMAQALDYLHGKKLVHRDVKPANTFLSITKNMVKASLGDFGVVKWGDFHASMSTGVLTATNQRGLGTLKYMSPEQAIRPKDVTVRSDIYSLGITLYELFTGRILATPHHVFEVMNARLQRGTTHARYLGMGVRVSTGSMTGADLVLDMHLRGQSGRPSIGKVRGRLEWMLEQG